MIRKPQHLLSAALAAVIFGFASIASAADVADIEIVSDSTAHTIKVSLDDLAIGESRQLTASSGQPAIVTRTEEGLVVEVAGKRTEILMPPQRDDMSLVDGGAGDDKTRVIVIDRESETTSLGDSDHRVLVLKDGEPGALNGREIEIITEDLVGPDGEVGNQRVMKLVTKNVADDDDGVTKVTVTRRITNDGESQD